MSARRKDQWKVYGQVPVDPEQLRFMIVMIWHPGWNAWRCGKADSLLLLWLSIGSQRSQLPWRADGWRLLFGTSSTITASRILRPATKFMNPGGAIVPTPALPVLHGPTHDSSILPQFCHLWIFIDCACCLPQVCNHYSRLFSCAAAVNGRSLWLAPLHTR